MPAQGVSLCLPNSESTAIEPVCHSQLKHNLHHPQLASVLVMKWFLIAAECQRGNKAIPIRLNSQDPRYVQGKTGLTNAGEPA